MEQLRKITIIEGPPPVFEEPSEAWPSSLEDCIRPFHTALTRMRTFNGPELVERCYHAWKDHEPIVLEYRATDGQIVQTPIQAARYVNTPEGHLLMVWVRLKPEDVEPNSGPERG
jgi:hypothetical protein